MNYFYQTILASITNVTFSLHLLKCYRVIMMKKVVAAFSSWAISYLSFTTDIKQHSSVFEIILINVILKAHILFLNHNIPQ